MSGFGDFTDDDAADTDPADPEAVARIFVALERDVTRDPSRLSFDELDPPERAMLVFSFALLLARLRRERSI